MNKYRNRKTEVDGHTFDSKKEASRYQELKLMAKAGDIVGLKLQVPYELIPSQKGANGKTIERPVRYLADFVYTDLATGQEVVEDVKGMRKRTPDYIIKRKLMLYVHGIRIKEV